MDGAITACFIGLCAIGMDLAERVRRVGLIPEGAAGQPRKLPPVAVGKDREELAAIPGQVVGQPSAGQGVGDRVGRELDQRCSPSEMIGVPVAS